MICKAISYNTLTVELERILFLMGCIDEEGNTEFSSPHFRELLRVYISILFPSLRQCFTSQRLKKLRQCINLVECWGTCVTLSMWSHNIVCKTIQDLLRKEREKKVGFLGLALKTLILEGAVVTVISAHRVAFYSETE